MQMFAGNLNQIIQIYKDVTIKNEVGEQVQEWVKKLTTRANVIHNNGSRTIVNNEVFYTQIRTFEVRHYVDVNDFDRIKYKNHFYQILEIDRNDELQKIRIVAEKVNE